MSEKKLFVQRVLTVGDRQLISVHEVAAKKGPKLDAEARKQRREDNKLMKKSRKTHRKRKKHGR